MTGQKAFEQMASSFFRLFQQKVDNDKLLVQMITEAMVLLVIFEPIMNEETLLDLK